jgi:hypothetical protein
MPDDTAGIIGRLPYLVSQNGFLPAFLAMAGEYRKLDFEC